jgi:hypothetical protein
LNRCQHPDGGFGGKKKKKKIFSTRRVKFVEQTLPFVYLKDD